MTAEYIANYRLLFEYPRSGYGAYDETHVKNIKNGLLGELGFLEYICEIIKTAYPDPSTRWDIVKNELGFCYLPVIGLYDEGYEFKFKDIVIDVKTYGTRSVTVDQIFNGIKLNGNPLNLFIDRTQKPGANIYVQAFILINGDIALAGYHIGLPPLKTWMPNPAYCKPVDELVNMNRLIDDIKKMISAKSS